MKYKIASDQRGATIVEFGIVAPVVFLLLLGMIELCLLLFADCALEGATSVAARIGKTGYTADGLTPEQYIVNRVQQLSAGIIDPGKLTITIHAYQNFSDIGSGADCPSGATTCPYTDGTGSAGQVVLYRVSYPWTFFTPLVAQVLGDSNGVFTLTAIATVKNEPL